MKKITAVVLSAMLLLTSCGGGNTPAPSGEGGDDAATFNKEVAIATSREVKNMDYVITAKTSDHEIMANLVDGLLEHDESGNIVGALAESWESNEDKSVWTFHLKPDVYWVTNITGEQYAPVTAEDFVTGLRHAAEFDSETGWLLEDIIDGFSDYVNSDFSDEAWEKVGVKALDDSTIEYTMVKDENGNPTPIPYFDSVTTYAILYPINKDFLESKGQGCRLGAPNKEDCAFGSLELDSVLINGGYFLTENVSKSKAVLEKNPSYWDADKVLIEKITRVYDGGEDPYSVIKNFEKGIYLQSAISPMWEDYKAYAEKYKGYINYEIPNATVFGVVFNFNRKEFNYTNYADDLELRQNTIDAIQNEDFRKALRAAFDVVKRQMVTSPEELAVQTCRNVNNFPTAGTQSDGTLYFDLVAKHLEEYEGEKYDLSDNGAAFLNKDKAMEYIEKAKEAGIKFPIHLDMLVVENSEKITKEGQSMKKSIEDNTDGNIIIELVMEQEDTVQNIAYYNDDPYTMDYDISTFTGWGPDYQDPKTFVDIYNPYSGYYMSSIGLGTVDMDGNLENKDIKEHIGLLEYDKLYREADKIVDDMDARYDVFAKADAYLLHRCIYIPTSQQLRTAMVSKFVPFTRPWAPVGMSEHKYKGWRTQEELVSNDEYDALYKEWEANMGK